MQEHETGSNGAGELIPLVMDDREPCEKMSAALAGCGCFSVEVRRLAAGDYLVDDALLIERKTLPDLVLSLAQGRLFRQALLLAEAELPAALILEGAAILHSAGPAGSGSQARCAVTAALRVRSRL